MCHRAPIAVWQVSWHVQTKRVLAKTACCVATAAAAAGAAAIAKFSTVCYSRNMHSTSH